MKTFAISLFAAAAVLISAAFLLRPATTSTPPSQPHFTPVPAAVATKPAEPATQPTAVPPTPPEPVKSAAVAETPTPSTKSEGASAAPMPSTPATESTAASSTKVEPTPTKLDPKLTTADKLTLAQTSTTDTSLRNSDYPRTFISAIKVDLASPEHAVRLTWSGPQAASQETGPFHSSPGRGLGTNNCDDPEESNRQDSNCTPKGVFRVQGFSNTMPTYAHCKFVTWFLLTRGIAFHSYPGIADYPASHGCIRLDEHAAQLIHNNTKIGATEVTVGGHWTFGR